MKEGEEEKMGNLGHPEALCRLIRQAAAGTEEDGKHGFCGAEAENLIRRKRLRLRSIGTERKQARKPLRKGKPRRGNRRLRESEAAGCLTAGAYSYHLETKTAWNASGQEACSVSLEYPVFEGGTDAEKP